jgi:hypothetical protein
VEVCRELSILLMKTAYDECKTKYLKQAACSVMLPIRDTSMSVSVINEEV